MRLGECCFGIHRFVFGRQVLGLSRNGGFLRSVSTRGYHRRGEFQKAMGSSGRQSNLSPLHGERTTNHQSNGHCLLFSQQGRWQDAVTAGQNEPNIQEHHTLAKIYGIFFAGTPRSVHGKTVERLQNFLWHKLEVQPLLGKHVGSQLSVHPNLGAFEYVWTFKLCSSRNVDWRRQETARTKTGHPAFHQNESL